MSSRPLCVLVVAFLAACGSTPPVASEPPFARMPADPAYLKPGESRTFEIRYTAHVTDVPAGSKSLRVWLPVPQDTPVQTITNLSFGGGTPSIGTETKYGNKIACFDVADPKASQDFTMSFTCTRKEQVTDLAKVAGDSTETDPSTATFLAPDELTIVDERIRKISDEITAGRTTTLEKEKAVYDYVMGHMKYDKSGTGWGRGDTNYACDAGKGNCTDFHALFMSLSRAAGVPAGFEIGLFLPYEVGSHEKPGGYHCWAFFRVPGKAWVPVDISEASKNPDRAAYFFGGHTNNRVTLSVGRDLVLVPPQAGAPRNYLLDPYAEADGRPVKTSKDWTYADAPARTGR